ncbi:unnamed protein product [Anisakis simplex]|uniref:Putative RNA-binding protein (inferred by orthology to a C. elegans protein) n=1 Tax=Anisakis simplex TaxID=6269 RepID=A0A0M3JS05_ANISI|nr:unnamed protein product [Anisakis simplex]
MDFKTDKSGFSRPAAMFKTLRRLHGHNLENQGLNDLTEAFQNFITRAKYFSIGRLRRTWSHSAIEFMKYRRLLPMLTSEGQRSDQFDGMHSVKFHIHLSAILPNLNTQFEGMLCPMKIGQLIFINFINSDDSFMSSAFIKRSDSIRSDVSVVSSSGVSLRHVKGEEKKIVVTNISPRVTNTQLASFFSKFGKISLCRIPSEERYQSIYATMPKVVRSSVVAHITFKKVEGAERAKNASADELKFYDKVMIVSSYSSARRRGTSAATNADENKTGAAIIALGNSSLDDDSLSLDSLAISTRSTSAFTLSDVSSLFGSRTSLQDLPSKVLEKIFSLLPAIDRIRLERVNKKFLEAAVKSWSFNDSFSFADDSCVNRTFTGTHPLRIVHLKSLLARCGVHLRRLNLSGVVHLLDEKAFEVISTYCPHLLEVNVSGLTGHSVALRNFGESLPRLQSFVYRDMVNVGDKSLWYFFKTNGSRMLNVDLRGCRRIKGRCLRLFSANLEKINLDGCYRLDNTAIEDLCLKSPNVIELRLSGCSQIDDQRLSLITRSMTDLRTFALCGDCFGSLSSEGLIAISRLSSLTDLSLDFNSAVSDEVLEALIDGAPHLSSLSLAYSGSDATLTEHSLRRVSDLKNLKTVDVSSLAAVNNDVFEDIIKGCKQLRDIRARSCTYLGDDGVYSLRTLRFLEHADFSGCLLLTTKGVQNLLNAFPRQSKNSVGEKEDRLNAITVVVGGSVCDVSALRTRATRIVIDPADYSSLSSNTARDLIISRSGVLEICVDSDEDVSGDEFESLTAHRSFIMDTLNIEEDDSPMDSEQSIKEWAEREARQLGLLNK